jgi:peptidoglycan/xylan/chitin deacetylase (PgdA/CDA1 family)
VQHNLAEWVQEGALPPTGAAWGAMHHARVWQHLLIEYARTLDPFEQKRSTIGCREQHIWLDRNGSSVPMREFIRTVAAWSGTISLLSNWSPSRAVRLTLWLHGGVILGLVLWPATWAWLLAAIIANHLLLGVLGMWPRSSLLGANLSRLPPSYGYIALTFDDGPDPDVTPYVLEVLDRYSAKASFFCVAKRAARHPDLVHEILIRGHSVENHSDRHPLAFAFYGPLSLYREITYAQGLLSQVVKSEPRFFRAPFGLRNPFLDPVLACTNLRYVSWTRRGFDRVSRSPGKVLARLTRRLSGGDILLLHDCSSHLPSADPPIVLQVLPALLDHIVHLGLRPVSLPIAFESLSPHSAVT